MFETHRSTTCIVVSKDKGYDPLLLHLNRNGLQCRRIEAMADLLPAKAEPVCRWCSTASTIDHYGGRWCSNCGRFATPPDPALLPSRQPGYRESEPEWNDRHWARDAAPSLVCAWCSTTGDIAGGIYDDGEWICGGCVARYTD